MEQYVVTGMTCAACQARVEKAVSKVEGVESCSVSLLTNSMSVEGNATPESIINAVENAGYGARKKGAETKRSYSIDDEKEALKDKETPKLKKRLIYSIVFLVLLMYISMGHGMLGLWVPTFLDGNYAAMGVTEMLLAIVVMFINRKFFVSGFKSLFSGSPNMDTLVALGSSAAFGYSLAELYIILNALFFGDKATAMSLGMNLYFETSAMIPTLITVGKLLESLSKGRTTDALKSLMNLAPKTAVVVRNGEEQKVQIEEVQVGDVFAVRPGETIPVDGVVVEGATSVNESALTGESVPVDKTEGSLVSAATLNTSGYIRARATRVGEDTTLSQIIKMVSDSAATKAPIARIADRVSAVFVPAVIGIAVLTFAVWMLLGQGVAFSIARAISVLVISCPCALGLATPVAIMVGNGVGAKNGILYKTAVAQETAGKINIVALDKTGTITSGKPEVTDILTENGYSEDELLSLAASLEQNSEHPLASAVTKYATEKNIPLKKVESFKALVGKGLSATLDGEEIFGGSAKFMTSKFTASESIKAKSLSEQGKTPLFFSKGNEVAGVIAVADTIKSDSAKAVKELQNMGVEVVMITGDNERTANAIAKEVGIENVIAGVLPNGKEKVIKNLKNRGKVAMVGDGINDAPALTTADLGIAIGAGADVAIDAADIVLMKSQLSDVSAAIRLSRASMRNIRQNLFWAFFYNVICIPLAAGFYSALFGWNFEMNPMVGAAAMSLSSVTVCLNALRLNLTDVHNTSRDKKLVNKTKSKEKLTMTKTLKINGMMCGHCEARVKKALEAVEGVDSAEVSHESGTAVVELSADVANEVLKNAVEAQDYTVEGVE